MLEFIKRFRKSLVLINKMFTDYKHLIYDISKPSLVIYSFMYLLLWENTEFKIKKEIGALLKDEMYTSDITKQKYMKHLSRKLSLLKKTKFKGAYPHGANDLINKTKNIFKEVLFV